MPKPEKKIVESEEKKKPGDVEPADHEDEGGEGDEPEVQLGADDGAIESEPAQRPSRDDRRRQRGNVISELETERKRSRDLEDRASRAETMLRDSYLRGGPPEPQRDDIQTELDSVYDDQEQLSAHISNMAGKLSPEDQKKFRARAVALRMKENELITRRVIRQNAPDPEEAETRAAIMSIKLDYPQVRDQKVYNRARAIYYQKQSEGEENSMGLWRSSVKQAVEGTSRPAPTERTQSRFTGGGRGAGGGGGDDAGPLKIAISEKRAQQLADGAYAHIKDKNKRMEMWKASMVKKNKEKRESAR